MSEKPKQPNAHALADPDRKARGRRRWRRVLVSGVSTLCISWVIVYFVPHVVDMVRAYNFRAPSSIVAIDKRLALTDRGTDIFYASYPQIDEKTTFNNNCQTQERTAAILGCFYKDRIFLYNLQKDELDGTLEVTAAHEMLHAAYQRLTILERWWVDKQIVAEYQKVKDQPMIKELMAYYTQAEPGAEIDELHSILGTVVTNLGPDLESYYGRYFKDRASVVALTAKYNKVFADLKAQSDAIEARLAVAEPEITALLAQYDATRATLEADIAVFNTRAHAGQFESQAAFDAERAAMLLRVNALNAQRDSINAKVAAYNADVAALNKISIHTNELYQSMNGAQTAETVQY